MAGLLLTIGLVMDCSPCHETALSSDGSEPTGLSFPHFANKQINKPMQITANIIIGKNFVINFFVFIYGHTFLENIWR